jgi:hypothetical protein
VQIFDAFNSLEYFVLKIRHIAKAQPLGASVKDDTTDNKQTVK